MLAAIKDIFNKPAERVVEPPESAQDAPKRLTGLDQMDKQDADRTHGDNDDGDDIEYVSIKKRLQRMPEHPM